MSSITAQMISNNVKYFFYSAKNKTEQKITFAVQKQ